MLLCRELEQKVHNETTAHLPGFDLCGFDKHIHKQLTWSKQPSPHEKCLPVSKASRKSSQESNDEGKYSPASVCSVLRGDFPGPLQSAAVLPVTLMEPGTTSGLCAWRRARSPQHNAVSTHPEGQQETLSVAQTNLGNDHILSNMIHAGVSD